MDYHPGGWDELVRGAGIDATDLFNEVHRWVNYESMLTACLVGKLVDDSELMAPPSAKSGPSSASFMKPTPKPSKNMVLSRCCTYNYESLN